jgi:ABC-type transporter Mla subunit MlaD
VTLRALVVLIGLAVFAAFHFEWLPYRPVAGRIYVTFPESVDIEVGAPVVYRGVEVGRVERKGLRQPSATGPASVELTLAFETEDLALRRDDGFAVEGAGILGTPHVRVLVAEEPSPELPDGSRVAGMPSLRARATDSAGDFLRRAGESARDTGLRWYESLAGDDAESDAPHSRQGDDPPKSQP